MEIDAVRAEMAATRAELARTRLRLEMFRSWTKRMPPLDAAEDIPPNPNVETPALPADPPGREAADRRVAAAAPEPANARFDRVFPGPPPIRPACQHVYPNDDTDQDRRGKPCRLRAWEGSDLWCWHHDPTPIAKRRGFPVRR